MNFNFFIEKVGYTYPFSLLGFIFDIHSPEYAIILFNVKIGIRKYW